ncbi:hypothetical protein [Streptomyces sp. NPDC001536]|uniref:hypothetical protein n=1 Tax=Streptomyces sp. NPDC001536 TaxID=3364583 RepID=UPI0036BDD5E1
MIKGWGAAASITFAIAAVVGVSGCGGDAEADAKKSPTASAAAPSFSEASKAFQDVAGTMYLDSECTKEAGTCWDKMTTAVKAARTLRTAMNGEKSVGPEFWTEAYALIDTMEEGYAVGEDLGADDFNTNRPKVFGTAHDLDDWLGEHPIQ